MKYPETITAELLDKAAHKTDDQVRADIADTEREAAGYAKCADAYAVIAQHHPVASERQIANFRADGLRGWAADATALAAYLRKLLVARGAERELTIAEEIMRREG